MKENQKAINIYLQNSFTHFTEIFQLWSTKKFQSDVTVA